MRKRANIPSPDQSPIDELRIEAAKHAVAPPASDKFLQAFSMAFRELLTGNQEVIDKTEQLYTQYAQRGRSPSSTEVIAKTQRSVQKRLLRQQQQANYATYPLGYDVAESWKAPLLATFSTDDRDPKGYENYLFDMIYLTHMGNVMGRYITLIPVIDFLSKRFEESPRILDVGCSRLIGDKKIIERATFEEVIAYTVNNSGATFRDDATTQKINELFIPKNDTRLSALREYAHIDGLDIMPYDDDEIKLHARSCSFYPKEFLDKFLVAEYDYYDAKAFDQIGYMQGNFVIDSEYNPVLHQMYHAAFLSTMMYQSTPEQRNLLLKNALDSVVDDGIVVVQDFVSVDPENPLRLNFPDHWFDEKFPYKTLIYDKTQPSQGFQEVFLWTTGRCRALQLGRGVTKLISC